jgi:hypothetical protein
MSTHAVQRALHTSASLVNDWSISAYRRLPVFDLNSTHTQLKITRPVNRGNVWDDPDDDAASAAALRSKSQVTNAGTQRKGFSRMTTALPSSS